MSDAEGVGGPLAGRRVVVTRARAQSAALVARLGDSGAEVLHIPVIEVVPPASWDSLDHVIDNEYDWLVFTSVNGVQSFVARMHVRAKDFASLKRSRIAAVGRVTADALEQFGLHVNVVPEHSNLDALVPLLPETQTGVRTAVIRAEEGRDALVDALRRKGGVVDLAIAYRTVGVAYDVNALTARIDGGAIDAVTFTSPSTVAHFFAPLAEPARRQLEAQAVMVAIGPSTSEALRTLAGITPFEARRSDVQGLHDAVVDALARR